MYVISICAIRCNNALERFDLIELGSSRLDLVSEIFAIIQRSWVVNLQESNDLLSIREILHLFSSARVEVEYRWRLKSHVLLEIIYSFYHYFILINNEVCC